MLPALQQDGDAALRREYLDSVKALARASREMSDTEKLRSDLLEKESALVENGQSSFVDSMKAQKKASENFFGELGATKRGMAVALTTNFGSVLENAKKAIKDDAFDAISGIGKQREKDGMERNTFLSRVLGAEKYRDSGKGDEFPRPDSPGDSPAEEDTGLLGLIETNTRELKDSFTRFMGDESDRDKARVRSETEASRERGKKRLPVLGGKDKAGPVTAGSVTGEIIGEVVGSALGVAAGGGLAAMAAKSMNFAKVAGRIGLRAVPIVGSIISIGLDTFSGVDLAKQWDTSTLAGVVGSVLGGADKGVKGMFKGAGKWALMGAAIGSVVPVVGTIAGGLIGAAVGGILGWIGGERIANFVDDAGTYLSDATTMAKDAVKGLFAKLITEPFDRLVKGVFGDDFVLGEDSIVEESTKIISDAKDRLIGRLSTWFRESVMGPAVGVFNGLFGTEVEGGDTVLADSIAEKKREIIERVRGFASGVVDSALESIGVDTDQPITFSGVMSSLRETVVSRVESVFTTVVDAGLASIGVSDPEAVRESIAATITRLKDDLVSRVTGMFDSLLDVDLPFTDQTPGSILTDLVPKAINGLVSRFKSLLGIGSDGELSLDLASVTDGMNIQEMVSSTIPDFLRSVGDFVKRIFTWDYWFGGDDVDAQASAAKDSIRRAKAMEERRGKLVSSLEDGVETDAGANAVSGFKSGDVSEAELRRVLESQGESEGLEALTAYETFTRNMNGSAELAEAIEKKRSRFAEQLRSSIDSFGLDKDDPQVKGLIDGFAEGRIALTALRAGLTTIRDSGSGNAKREAEWALENFGQYETAMTALRKENEPRVVQPEISTAADTVEMNRTDKEASDTARRAEAQSGGAVVAATISNSTVNRHQTINLPVSPTNNDPTFSMHPNGNTALSHTGN